MKLRIIGFLLIIVGIALSGTVAYLTTRTEQGPLVFAENIMLRELWGRYKQGYVEPGTGRSIDKQRDNITTSEGQSYTMLRAVWMDDRETFDLAWKWTRENLDRPDDELFSWLWGKRPDGSYGILTNQNGQNTATDGDSDIALALVFAANRWQDDAYLDQANKIISDIWEKEVVLINGKPVLAANNLEKQSPDRTIVNVSYFSPYAYRIFAQVDKKAGHDWSALVANSYDVIDQTLEAPLDKGKSAGLPPDWVDLDKRTGALRPVREASLTTDYGYDAMRTPWRLALDYAWFQEPRAKASLEKMRFLSTEWQKDQTLASVYSHDGQVIDANESPAIYGGDIGYFMVAAPELKEAVYAQRLKVLYSPDKQDWNDRELSYYSANWAWFGLALYNDKLPNLAASRQ